MKKFLIEEYDPTDCPRKERIKAASLKEALTTYLLDCGLTQKEAEEEVKDIQPDTKYEEVDFGDGALVTIEEYE
jgi:hypothetical protein